MTYPSTIFDLHRAYEAGTIKCEEVCKSAVRKAFESISDRSERRSNEWIYVSKVEDVETQLRKLKKLDFDLDKYPLYGIPFAVKDNIDVANVPTTVACPKVAYTPTTSAVVVQKILDAGGIFIGKTNLDQFATGLVGTRSPYGPVMSTWSSTHVAGGSSSGSATVVSRGVVPFSLGTDTAGSGRVPAAFNGIVGLKPSYGLVSNNGVYPACASLDCVSIFALTTSDAATVLRVIEDDPFTLENFAPKPGPSTFPDKIRIAVPSSWPDPKKTPISDHVKTHFENFKKYWGERAEIVEIKMDTLWRVGSELYGGPWLADRYLAVKDVIESDPDAMDPTVREIMQPGSNWTGYETFSIFEELKQRQIDCNDIWKKADVLLVPTVPHHPTFEQVSESPESRIQVNAQLGTYTTFINFLGWSALSVPVPDSGKMPFGVTWIAPAGYDVALVRLSCRHRNEMDAFKVGAPSANIVASKESLDMPTSLPRTEKTMKIAVCGAHLAGMPLHYQLCDARALLDKATKTSNNYRLYALDTIPPKPALVRKSSGCAIDIEVYDVPIENVGQFLFLIPPPLGLGSVECADGSWVHGFIAESRATDNAIDVSEFGGWRQYIGTKRRRKPSSQCHVL